MCVNCKLVRDILYEINMYLLRPKGVLLVTETNRDATETTAIRSYPG